MLQYLSVSITQVVAFAFGRLFTIAKFHLYIKDTTTLFYTLVNKLYVQTNNKISI